MLFHKINIITFLAYEIRIHMNKTPLAITVLAIVAATAIGLVTTQGAAAQVVPPPLPPPTTTNTNSFNTNNQASQTNTITASATGGDGGTGSGSYGGDATAIAAGFNQAAQSGAFGTSTSNVTIDIG
jgi:hypothetical protein